MYEMNSSQTCQFSSVGEGLTNVGMCRNVRIYVGTAVPMMPTYDITDSNQKNGMKWNRTEF